jgi:carbamoyl-phosphate synthase large subunit
MSYTILITCVGGELAPHLIKLAQNSGRHKLRIVGTDASADAAGRHFADKFVQVPFGTDDNYIERIAEIAAIESVDLILPTSDEEALALSKNRSTVEASGAMLACTDAETLLTVSNKADCYRALSQFGMSVPFWREAKSVEELRDVVSDAVREYTELVVKPAAERGGRGVCVIRDDLVGEHLYQGGREVHLDLETFLKTRVQTFSDHFPAIVMRRLVEPVYDVDMLAWQGTPLRVVPRRRVDSALPNEGHTIVGNKDLISLGTDLIENFKLSWLYDCDVMYDEDGTPCILEINPRPSGSVAATITAGVPLLDDLVSLAKGEPLPEVEVPVGRVVVPYKAIASSRA